jgi:hypothetical protein
LWFDEYSVPRYCEFSPERKGNIYTSEAALVEIACQGCTRRLKVAISLRPDPARDIATDIREKELHYGDPPNVDCCGAGASMMNVPIRVIEYWKRSDDMKWERDRSLEIDIFPE